MIAKKLIIVAVSAAVCGLITACNDKDSGGQGIRAVSATDTTTTNTTDAGWGNVTSSHIVTASAAYIADDPTGDLSVAAANYPATLSGVAALSSTTRVDETDAGKVILYKDDSRIAIFSMANGQVVTEEGLPAGLVTEMGFDAGTPAAEGQQADQFLHFKLHECITPATQEQDQDKDQGKDQDQGKDKAPVVDKAPTCLDSVVVLQFKPEEKVVEQKQDQKQEEPKPVEQKQEEPKPAQDQQKPDTGVTT